MDRTLERVYSAGLELLEATTPREAFRAIVNKAVKLVDGSDGRIILKEDGRFKVVYESSERTSLPRKVRKTGYAYASFTNQASFYVDRDQINKIYPEISQKGIAGAVFIPLAYKDKTIGVLIVQFIKPVKLSPLQLNILKIFGSMATLAIRKAEAGMENQKALEIRDLFISMAAHELRTPLTTINGYVQLLKNKTAGKNTPEARWIEELSWETFRLTKLVSEMLEVNRIKTGELPYDWQECSLKEILRRAIMDFRFNHPERTINYDDSLQLGKDIIVGDFDKLLQLLTNLLDNAAKFSPSDKEIVIKLQYKGGSFLITILDQGIGIARKDLRKIFDVFYKGHEGKIQGMGLGLYLAKAIVDRHRGEIHVHSKKNRGTTVEVFLPISKHA